MPVLRLESAAPIATACGCERENSARGGTSLQANLSLTSSAGAAARSQNQLSLLVLVRCSDLRVTIEFARGGISGHGPW